MIKCILLYFVACSILKRQLNIDILDENGTSISNVIKKVLNLILLRYC